MALFLIPICFRKVSRVPQNGFILRIRASGWKGWKPPWRASPAAWLPRSAGARNRHLLEQFGNDEFVTLPTRIDRLTATAAELLAEERPELIVAADLEWFF